MRLSSLDVDKEVVLTVPMICAFSAISLFQLMFSHAPHFTHQKLANQILPMQLQKNQKKRKEKKKETRKVRKNSLKKLESLKQQKKNRKRIKKLRKRKLRKRKRKLKKRKLKNTQKDKFTAQMITLLSNLLRILTLENLQSPVTNVERQTFKISLCFTGAIKKIHSLVLMICAQFAMKTLSQAKCKQNLKLF